GLDQARAAPAVPHPEMHWEDRASGSDGQGTATNRPTPQWAPDRPQAISRALVAHGSLLLTRRRIPLPSTRKKVPKTTWRAQPSTTALAKPQARADIESSPQENPLAHGPQVATMI